MQYTNLRNEHLKLRIVIGAVDYFTYLTALMKWSQTVSTNLVDNGFYKPIRKMRNVDGLGMRLRITRFMENIHGNERTAFLRLRLAILPPASSGIICVEEIQSCHDPMTVRRKWHIRRSITKEHHPGLTARSMHFIARLVL